MQLYKLQQTSRDQVREAIGEVSAVTARIQGVSGIAGMYRYRSRDVLWHLQRLQRRGHGAARSEPRGLVQSVRPTVLIENDAPISRQTAGKGGVAPRTPLNTQGHITCELRREPAGRHGNFLY